MSETILHKRELASDPIAQFEAWFAAAAKAGAREHNAMTLCTASAAGVPSARIVLLKQVDANGFAFFTNYNSQKGRELVENPHAALVFHWDTNAFGRQVRIVGDVAKVSAAESDAYFFSRAIGSRIGAWASDQDAVLENREALDAAVAHYTQKFADGNVPRPPHWGGFRLTPRAFDFWESRPSRLHDRFRYTRNGAGWQLDRLSP